MAPHWLTLENPHPLTVEILAGLREYYDAADLSVCQHKVDALVRKEIPGKDFDQMDYLRLKDKAEPILRDVEKLFSDEEEEVA